MERKSKNLVSITEENFEKIKHLDENGVEFWYARKLQEILDYKEWRKFENVIKKVREACKTVILGNLNILSTPTKRSKCLKERKR